MYLEYEARRNCTFFLGAGASYSDGVPLQKDIIPTILNPEPEEFKESKLRKFVSVFIEDNFSYSRDDEIYPTLENVFSYLNHFIENEVALSKIYSLEKLIQVKEGLIKLIYYITSRSTRSPLTQYEIEKNGRDKDSIYSFFWEKAAKTNRNFSVITTNYDNQIDDAFDKWMYAKHGLIDYCISFINYTKEEDFIGFDWWVNPREPIPNWTDCDPRPIKLIKIHGSLNWKFCKCCSETLLTPWNSHINLETGELTRFDPRWFGEGENMTLCPRDGYPLSTMIVPPSYSKSLRHPVIQNLMYEAQKEIRVAKKVAFVGYSFPDADIHIKAIFNKNLRDDSRLYVVNPSLNKISKEAYRGLSKNITFIEKDFLSAIEDGLIEELIA